MAINLCDYGKQTDLQVVGGFNLEAKTYSPEEAAIIARETFNASVILRGISPQPLQEGEVITEMPDPFVTFHLDVINKKRLKRDSLRVDLRSRATDGRRADECGFNPTPPVDNQINETLLVQEFGIETQLCHADLLSTYKQKAMRYSLENGWDSPWLTLEMEYGMLKAIKEGVDANAFMGDYGSGDKFRAHTDGWIKDVVLSMGTVKNSIGVWTATGDLTDMCIEYQIGGQFGSIEFDTDTATTLANFVTELTVTHPQYFYDFNGVSVFESVTSDSDSITIELKQPYDMIFEVGIVLTNCDGFTRCSDGTLKANTAVTGATLTFELTQKMVTGEQPISFDWQTVNALNVMDILDGMYMEITLRKPELLTDPTFTLFVAPNVMAAYDIAAKRSNQNYVGSGGPLNNAPVFIWSGTRMQALPGKLLPNDFIFGAKPGNLHMGTYLGSQFNEWKTYIHPMSNNVDVKMLATMGFKTVRRDEIVGTFTPTTGVHTFNFGARQPEMFDA